MNSLRTWVGLAVLAGAVFSGAAARAAADEWTSSFFAIGDLDNDDSNNSSRDTVVIRKSGHGSFPNPAGCTGASSYATIKSTASAASKELMTRMLISAFLAGRKVKIGVSGNVCSGSGTNGVPVFFAVAMEESN